MMSIDLKKYPLDPELIAYLDAVAKHYPEYDGPGEIATTRMHYLDMCAAFEAPIDEKIAITEHKIPGRNGEIPIRIYENPQHHSPVTAIYFHGGGFVVGNLDSHNSICAEISLSTGYRVIAVDYRLAPEHPHPQPFDDALDVYLAMDHGHTVVCGDSAGANLAAAICVAQHGGPRQPLGQVLIYPWLGGELFNLGSYEENFDAPGLTRKEIEQFRDLRTHGPAEMHDPTYYPLAHRDFTDLPRCIAFAAQFDPIRDDAVEYVARLQQAGVDARCVVEPGLFHGYLRARHMSNRVSASFTRVCEAISELGKF